MIYVKYGWIMVSVFLVSGMLKAYPFGSSKDVREWEREDREWEARRFHPYTAADFRERIVTVRRDDVKKSPESTTTLKEIITKQASKIAALEATLKKNEERYQQSLRIAKDEQSV